MAGNWHVATFIGPGGSADNGRETISVAIEGGGCSTKDLMGLCHKVIGLTILCFL